VIFLHFQGGIYFFQIVDYYAAAVSLMYIAFFECAAIVWLYGANRLSANVRDMSGAKPNVFFRICWLVVSPALILVRKQFL
jgi:solute carrier family 6 GABA transporter-like protein 6/8/11/12/13